MFNNEGFGGLMFQGAPFDPIDDDIAKALPHCDFVPGAFGDVVYCPPPFGVCAPVPPIPFLGIPVHGPGGVSDVVGAALGEGFPGHLVGGNPEFDGWPSWHSATHQQMYYRWLERAFHGGLKLMVLLGSNNQTFCQLVNQKAGYGCNDMKAVERAIEGAKSLERFIDAQNGGDGWFKIAYSGRQARQIINSGKMAVILGAEVPSLFDCFKNNGGCDEAWVSAELDRYYNMGLRHLFPIHNADNRFGGTAIYTEIFDLNNKNITGDWWDVGSCDAGSGIDFHLNMFDTIHDGLTAAEIAAAVAGFPPALAALVTPLLVSTGALPPRPPAGPNCNLRGLTATGEFLINAMMDKKMIIDLDHMSARALDRTLDIASARHYPAVVMGHTGLLHTNKPGRNKASEGNKRDDQIERLRVLGGLMGVIHHQGGTKDIVEFPPRVPFDCGNSSKAWAQVYLYAVELMKGGAVAFGSDFNGFAGQIAPRFGSDPCGDEVALRPQIDRGSYPFDLYDGSGTMDRSVVENKTFDFNDDGLAHIGMYPDFIRDLEAIGISRDDLRPLFSSAEAYVLMWEKAENKAPVAHAVSVTVAAGANCLASASIDNGSRDPDGDPIIVSQSPPGPYPLGATLVTLTVTDCFGAKSTSLATVTVVDQTAPSVACPASQVAPATMPSGAAVKYPAATVQDNCPDAAVSCSRSSGDIFRIGDTTVECTARDGAGNRSMCTFNVHIKGAIEQTADLTNIVKACQLPHGIENSLLVKLSAALDDISENDRDGATRHLDAFIHHVNAKAGKKSFTLGCANEMRFIARRIQAVLGSEPKRVAMPGTGPDRIPESAASRKIEEGVTAGLVLKPNPFRSSMAVEFTLGSPEGVNIEVIDVEGRLVRRVFRGWLGGGSHSVRWNGLDEQGHKTSAGVYLIRLVTGDRTVVSKVLRL